MLLSSLEFLKTRFCDNYVIECELKATMSMQEDGWVIDQLF
jgi:hypothetical protein